MFESNNGSSSGIMDFQDDRLYLILLSDPTTGEADRLRRDTFRYEIRGKSLMIGDSAIFDITGSDENAEISSVNDSMVRFQLRRVPFQPGDITPSCIQKSFSLTKDGTESKAIYDFVNDSVVLIHAEPSSFHAMGYSVQEFKGYHFLKIFSPKYEWANISGYTENSVSLQLYNGELLQLDVEPRIFERNNLLGVWKEVMDDRPRPPLPLGARPVDQYYTLSIEEDSMRVEIMGRSQKIKWELGNSGKMIYFPEIIYEPNGVWSIVQITDTSMVIMRNEIWEKVEMTLSKESS